MFHLATQLHGMRVQTLAESDYQQLEMRLCIALDL
jgi:hypothetical protein